MIHGKSVPHSFYIRSQNSKVRVMFMHNESIFLWLAFRRQMAIRMLLLTISLHRKSQHLLTEKRYSWFKFIESFSTKRFLPL